jgi:hypothetical protein
MPHRHRSRPILDVDGEMTYLATERGHAGAIGQRGFHIRCFDDGWTVVEAGGVTYPVSPHMTVYEYFRWLFAADVHPMERTGSGD